MFRIFFIIAFAFINTAHANEKLNLGSTFDSMSKHSTVISSCIKPELLENNFDIINYSSSLNFEYTKMIEQIQKSMGIDINTTLNIGPFTKSMDYHYGLTSIEDDFSLKINYFYLYSGELIFRDISKFNAFSSLTNEAQKIYLIDKRRFRELCGDGYISSLYANAGLILTFSLQFNSKIEKQYYENQFVATKDLQNILSIIKHHSDNSTFNIDAQGIQIGGNRKLSKLTQC